MKLRLIKTLSFWLNTFAVTMALLFIDMYLLQPKLVLGQRIGQGLFYLRGYYETSEIVNGEVKHFLVTEQGIGTFFIPCVVATALTVVYGAILIYRRNAARQNRQL